MISVITVCFNSAKTIRKTFSYKLQRVQTEVKYEGTEYIIVRQDDILAVVE